MATEISNGKQTVKLYCSVNRAKAIYQLAYYMGGRRVQKNFADKAEAKRVSRRRHLRTLCAALEHRTPLRPNQDHSRFGRFAVPMPGIDGEALIFTR